MSEVNILRFDPGIMEEPQVQTYRVPYADGQTVTDALLYISREIDGSLAFRAYCQAGLCYGCLIQIDGSARCPCRTRLKERMTLGPLKNRKVVRDLVVELD
jgi:succinate dehydrogenase/fumarate reductase-like Fe-S protein